MEPQQNEVESVTAPLRKVTPLSKYLAMVLFILLPFIGGYVGYVYAPEKVVERVIISDSQKNEVDVNALSAQYKTYRNDLLGVSFEYPDTWIISESLSGSTSPTYIGNVITVTSPDYQPESSGSQIVLSIMEISVLGDAHNSVSDILLGKTSGKGGIADPVAIEVSGIEAVSYTTSHESSSWKMTAFDNNSQRYSIGMSFQGGQSQDYLEVYNNLVETIKVLN